MNDPSNPPPIAPIPTNPATPGGPPADVTAPPGTALEISRQLNANSIDDAQAGKLPRLETSLACKSGKANPSEPRGGQA